MELFDVRRMAVELLARHGLGHWRVVFDRSKTRAGQCHVTPREISLSAPLMRLQEYPEVQETILHAIAHALVGPDHGHDETWHRTARQIGASGAREVRMASTPAADWLGTCRAGHEFPRHRRPSGPMLCRTCERDGCDLEAALVTWTYKGRSVPMTPAYRSAEAAMRARVAATATGQRGA